MYCSVQSRSSVGMHNAQPVTDTVMNELEKVTGGRDVSDDGAQKQ